MSKFDLVKIATKQVIKEIDSYVRVMLKKNHESARHISLGEKKTTIINELDLKNIRQIKATIEEANGY